MKAKNLNDKDTERFLTQSISFGKNISILIDNLSAKSKKSLEKIGVKYVTGEQPGIETYMLIREGKNFSLSRGIKDQVLKASFSEDKEEKFSYVATITPDEFISRCYNYRTTISRKGNTLSGMIFNSESKFSKLNTNGKTVLGHSFLNDGNDFKHEIDRENYEIKTILELWNLLPGLSNNIVNVSVGGPTIPSDGQKHQRIK